jgi:hypothetical protein
VKDTILLLENCEQAAFLGVRAFTRLSEFLKEITCDNQFFCKEVVTDSLGAKMLELVQTVNNENIEFVSNLLAALSNICFEKHGAGSVTKTILPQIVNVLRFVFETNSPQQEFVANFEHQLKVVP